MKKKLSCLVVFLLLFLTSCGVISNSNNEKLEPSATFSSFNYTYTDEDYKYAQEVMKEARDLANKGVNGDRVVELYSWMEEEQSKLSYYGQVEMINYYMTGNKQYSEKQESFQATRLDLRETQLDLYEPCSKNALREAFFGDATDAQVQKAVDNAKKEKQKMPLYKRQTELQNEAVAIGDAEAMKPILLETINVNNQIAELSGYDNYLDYAFKGVYGRGYEPSRVKDIIKNVCDYAYPFYQELKDEYFNSYANITNKDQAEIDKFSKVCFKDYYNLINDYTKSLGGDINKIYNDLLNSKYLFVSSAKTAISSAWTDFNYNDNTPVLFMGNGDYYQCVNTFTHEFGHYLNLYSVSSGGGDYDTCETHSQSNEALFQVYLRNNYKNMTEAGLKTLNYNWLVNILDGIISCALVYACEEVLYAEDNLTIDKIDNLCKQSLRSYGFDLADMPGLVEYGIMCAACSPAYYISYATSGISSVSMYKMGLDNYADAASTYLNLIKVGDWYTYPEKIVELKLTNALDATEVEALFKMSNFR